MQSYAPRSFLDTLVYKTKAAERSITAYHNVPFPKLRHIDLKGTDFFANDPRSILVDKVLNWLTERCGRKAVIGVFRLDDCYYISSNDGERLKKRNCC